MLERVLLDANAVLNAAFIPQSWSRLVVSKLVQQRTALFVGSRSLSEARVIAWGIAADLGRKTDPALVIEQFVRQIGAVEVPPSDDTIEAAVPEHDHHVVREAITAKATIFTSDGKLWAGCNAVRRSAVLPLQALRFLDGFSLPTTIFGIRPGRRSGSVFTRAYPGSWGGQQGAGQFTIVEFFGRLWLYYCRERRAWVVEMAEIGLLEIAAEISAEAMQVVSVSWEVGKWVRLRVGSVEAPFDLPMPHPLQADLLEGFSIGHREHGEHGWSGFINACVINDRPIGDLWSVLRTSTELTPNPYDLDRLRQAMAQALQ